MIGNPPPTSENQVEMESAPPPGTELVGPGVAPAEAGSSRCSTCGRALPRGGRGQPQRFCHPEHTRWQVPDRVKGGTKLVTCRDVAAAWQLELDTRGRTDASGPPIDLHGLAEQVNAWRDAATQVLGPAQALAERGAALQDILANDVAASRRAAEIAAAQVRDMRGQVQVAQADAETARDEARRDRAAAATATADAQAARLAETTARAAEQRAVGALKKEESRRVEADAKRDAAVTAREHTETENYTLRTTIEQLEQRITEIEAAAGEAAARHHEEIGRMYAAHADALDSARAEHDRRLNEQIEAERARLAGELARATDAHTAELTRLTTELEAARTAATMDAQAHTTALGRLNRDLGAAESATASAETRATVANHTLHRLRTALTALIADAPDDLPVQLADLLADPEVGDLR